MQTRDDGENRNLLFVHWGVDDEWERGHLDQEKLIELSSKEREKKKEEKLAEVDWLEMRWSDRMQEKLEADWLFWLWSLLLLLLHSRWLLFSSSWMHAC